MKRSLISLSRLVVALGRSWSITPVKITSKSSALLKSTKRLLRIREINQVLARLITQQGVRLLKTQNWETQPIPFSIHTTLRKSFSRNFSIRECFLRLVSMLIVPMRLKVQGERHLCKYLGFTAMSQSEVTIKLFYLMSMKDLCKKHWLLSKRINCSTICVTCIF